MASAINMFPLMYWIFIYMLCGIWISAAYHPHIECQEDSVDVEIDMDKMPKHAEEKLYVGSNPQKPTCRSYAKNNLRILKFLLVDCNPLITETEADIIYSYNIAIRTKSKFKRHHKRVRSHWTVKTEQMPLAQRRRRSVALFTRAITRARPYSIQVICKYSKTAVVHADFYAGAYITTFRGAANGNYNFGIALYKSEQFMNVYPRGGTITLGTPVYVRIDFMNKAAVDMYVQDCYVRPADSNVMYKKNLIEDGCFGDELSFKEISSMVSSKSYAFKFTAFKFPQYSKLLLKCELKVCSTKNAGKGKCRQPHQCSLTKRDLITNNIVYPISIPFNVE